MLNTGSTRWPRTTLASRKVNHFRELDHWYRLTLPQLRESPETWIRISRTLERLGCRSGLWGRGCRSRRVHRRDQCPPVIQLPRDCSAPSVHSAWPSITSPSRGFSRTRKKAWHTTEMGIGLSRSAQAPSPGSAPTTAIVQPRTAGTSLRPWWLLSRSPSGGLTRADGRKIV